MLKADTHEGFCSRSMLQGHAPGASSQAKLSELENAPSCVLTNVGRFANESFRQRLFRKRLLSVRKRLWSVRNI